MKTLSIAWAASLLLPALAACNTSGADAPLAAQAGSQANTAGAAAPEAPISWKTGQFHLEPGQERYLCFSQPLAEDAVIGAYSADSAAFVHHIIFVRALAPEPAGFAECDVAFRMSWDPVFIAGAGKSKLEFPSDAGHILKKNTQMLVQMHLLNVTDKPVDGSLTIDMHKSANKNPRPVNTYIFGSMNVRLPPLQKSEVVGQCELKEPVNLIAGFPHMHLLGRGMRVEAGPTWDTVKSVFERIPFDFNYQSINSVSVALKAGDKVRVTCQYQNTEPTEVTYGESTHNEMCFFVGFAVDRTAISACDLGQASGTMMH
jgi:hypothetical protein